MIRFLLIVLLTLPALGASAVNGVSGATKVNGITASKVNGVALSSLTNGLLVSLPLNEASGNAVDAGTQGWDFTQQGTVGAGSGGTANSRGTYSSANYFDRAESTFNNLNTGAYTVAGWFYLNAASSVQVVAGHSPNTGTGEGVFILYCDVTGFSPTATPTFAVRNETSGDCINVSVSGSPPSTGAWHLLIGSFNSATGEATCQMDNGTVATGTITGTPGTPASGSLRVGGLNYPAVPYPVNGYLGKVKIWNRVITTAERTQLWNGGTFSSAP